MRMSRALAVASLLLPAVVAGAVVGGSPAQAGDPADVFVPRWCSGPTPLAPCVVSATLNSSPITNSSPDFDITMTGALADGTDNYFQWQVEDIGSDSIETTDTWSITFDTGTLNPRYTEAYSGVPETTRTNDGDGTFKITYRAKPVVTTTGCDEDGGWPPSCTSTATSWTTQLSGEVHDKSDFGNGYDRSQNADDVSGVFLETAGDGSPLLTSDMANSHQYDDSGTLRTFIGQARFRLPYAFLRDDFGIPNPETLTPGSLTGVVKRPDGSTAPGSFSVMQDPSGGAIYVDASGITFSVKQLRVRTGTIVPTKPTQVSATRTRPGRGFVDFEPSTPRGANVTGYAGKCVVVGGSHTVTATSDNIVRFTGLRTGKAYDCKVRARSKAGAGPWSATVRMSRTPISPG